MALTLQTTVTPDKLAAAFDLEPRALLAVFEALGETLSDSFDRATFRHDLKVAAFEAVEAHGVSPCLRALAVITDIQTILQAEINGALEDANPRSAVQIEEDL